MGKIGALGSVLLDTVEDNCENIFCLPVIIRRRSTPGGSKDYCEVCGLAISRSLNGSYSRIGYFCKSNPGSKADAYALFDGLSEGDVEII